MRNLIGFRRFGAINFGVLTAVVFLSRLFSCRPSQAADTIFFEDFDNGYAGWTTSGNVSSDNSPTIGSNSARMKKDGQFWRTIDTRGYSNISLMWKMAAVVCWCRHQGVLRIFCELCVIHYEDCRVDADPF